MVGLTSFLSAKHSRLARVWLSAGSDVVLMKQRNPVNIKTMSDRLVAPENNADTPIRHLSFGAWRRYFLRTQIERAERGR